MIVSDGIWWKRERGGSPLFSLSTKEEEEDIAHFMAMSGDKWGCWMLLEGEKEKAEGEQREMNKWRWCIYTTRSKSRLGACEM